MNYVLITTARNEEANIGRVIRSMECQRVRPERWLICDDGSTDRTAEIISQHARRHEWIAPVYLPGHGRHRIGSKIRCFNAAYESLRGCEFDVIGNLDADVSFEADYFEFLLGVLEQEPGLGVVGTVFTEHGQQRYDYRYTDPRHVSGCVQLFRRACYEAIGGYALLPPGSSGPEDWIAVVTARMLGWGTRCCEEKRFVHHRVMGTAAHTLCLAKIKQGKLDYTVGNHPLWQLFRSAYNMSKRPRLVGGLCMMLGFVGACLLRVRRSVPPEVVRFHRREQMVRLHGAVGGRLELLKAAKLRLAPSGGRRAARES